MAGDPSLRAALSAVADRRWRYHRFRSTLCLRAFVFNKGERQIGGSMRMFALKS